MQNPNPSSAAAMSGIGPAGAPSETRAEADAATTSAPRDESHSRANDRTETAGHVAPAHAHTNGGHAADTHDEHSGETTRANSERDSPIAHDARALNGAHPDMYLVNVDGDGAKPKSSGVDVEAAKKDFDKLQRTFSKASSLNRRKSRNSEKGQPNFDPEKGGDHGEEFDLLEYLSHSELGSHPDSGFKFKALGVVWENHKVVGAGGMRLNIRVFPDAFKELLFKPIMPILMKMEKFAPKPKTILHNFNGIIAPGEMCLVLGRPGSGCSTFLKTIANEREGYLSINGRVEYE